MPKNDQKRQKTGNGKGRPPPESSDEDYDPNEEEPVIVTIDVDDMIKDILGIGRKEKVEEIEEETEETKFLKTLSNRKRKRIERLESEIMKQEKNPVPLKYKVLLSEIPDKSKRQILEKINFFESLSRMSSEYQKMLKYMEALEKIPFGSFIKLPVNRRSPGEKLKSFLTTIHQKLDESTYGQDSAKLSILETVAKWITNPNSKGNVIGLCGPPGIGKTSLIKNGLSKALNVPFGFVGLGGSTCSAYLQGHDFTYEGSKCGRIVEILIENKCMNPIIFFDELDKISETKSGEEVTGLLTHLTDASQNNSFSDKYFSGIDFDLSKCFFIFLLMMNQKSIQF